LQGQLGRPRLRIEQGQFVRQRPQVGLRSALDGSLPAGTPEPGRRPRTPLGSRSWATAAPAVPTAARLAGSPTAGPPPAPRRPPARAPPRKGKGVNVFREAQASRARKPRRQPGRRQRPTARASCSYSARVVRTSARAPDPTRQRTNNSKVTNSNHRYRMTSTSGLLRSHSVNVRML
jgi:hypothetical protein